MREPRLVAVVQQVIEAFSRAACRCLANAVQWLSSQKGDLRAGAAAVLIHAYSWWHTSLAALSAESCTTYYVPYTIHIPLASSFGPLRKPAATERLLPRSLSFLAQLLKGLQGWHCKRATGGVLFWGPHMSHGRNSLYKAYYSSLIRALHNPYVLAFKEILNMAHMRDLMILGPHS